MNHAVRWDVRGGILDLGDIPGGNSYSHASAISADGSTVVGQGSIGTNYGDRAAMWTEVTGMYSLGALPGVTTSTAKAVSSDGTVVVGGGSSRAFRWTSQSGMVDLGYGVANGVSADGSVVVGTYNALDTAFRWTQEEGLVSLGVLPGDYYSSGGNAISADGSVIVGASVRVGATQAYRWTSETGMVGLGDLPGGAYFSSPTTVSPDGSIVLGRSNTAMGDEAMIWDASHGMRNLREPARTAVNGGQPQPDISTAQAAFFTLTAYRNPKFEERFLGFVDRVAPTVDQARGMVAVTVRVVPPLQVDGETHKAILAQLDADSRKAVLETAAAAKSGKGSYTIKPGMWADARVASEVREGVLVAPGAGLVGDTEVLWIISKPKSSDEKTGVARRVDIRGRRGVTSEGVFEILMPRPSRGEGDLREGDLVVVRGQTLLRDGQNVRLNYLGQ